MTTFEERSLISGLPKDLELCAQFLEHFMKIRAIVRHREALGLSALALSLGPSNQPRENITTMKSMIY